MSNLYTQQENTWAAMISNCRITQEQIDWTREKFKDELGEDGNPTFAQIIAACKEQTPPYELWFREPTERTGFF